MWLFKKFIAVEQSTEFIDKRSHLGERQDEEWSEFRFEDLCFLDFLWLEVDPNSGRWLEGITMVTGCTISGYIGVATILPLSVTTFPLSVVSACHFFNMSLKTLLFPSGSMLTITSGKSNQMLINQKGR